MYNAAELNDLMTINYKEYSHIEQHNILSKH